MKRANISVYGLNYNGYILLESIEDINNYREEKFNGLVKESAQSLIDRLRTRNRSHNIDVITHATELRCDLFKEGVLNAQSNIVGGVMTSFYKIISKGMKIAINPFNCISHFPVPTEAEITVISENEKYTESDIRVAKWFGGAHWYAKIGHIDVVIDGEQKWNAKWVAQQKAEQFLSEMNQKSKSRVG